MAMNDKTFSEALTFTRASTKWVWNGTGKLVEVPVDQPAYDHDPVTGEALGILIEPGATNLLANSTDSVAIQGTLTAGIGGPTGSFSTWAHDSASTMDHIGVRSANSHGGMTVDTLSTASVFVETPDRYIYISSNNGGSQTNVGVVYRIDTQDMLPTKLFSGNATNFSTNAIRLTGNWYKVTLSFAQTGNSGNKFLGIFCSPELLELGTTRIHGDGSLSSGFSVSGWQLETGPVATSYIPTAGAAVTRAADWMTRDFGTEIRGARQFTVVAHSPGIISTSATGTIREPAITRMRATPSASPRFSEFSLITGASRAYGSFTSDVYPAPIGSSSNDGKPVKAALSVDFDTGAFVVAGNGLSASHSVPDSIGYNLARVIFATKADNGHLSMAAHQYRVGNVSYYPYAMTAAELESLTAL